jgi:hypothetical protein
MEKQIKALESNLMKGKAKNKYALANKVKTLKKKLIKTNQKTAWSNFLAN